MAESEWDRARRQYDNRLADICAEGRLATEISALNARLRAPGAPAGPDRAGGQPDLKEKSREETRDRWDRYKKSALADIATHEPVHPPKGWLRALESIDIQDADAEERLKALLAEVEEAIDPTRKSREAMERQAAHFFGSVVPIKPEPPSPDTGRPSGGRGRVNRLGLEQERKRQERAALVESRRVGLKLIASHVRGLISVREQWAQMGT